MQSWHAGLLALSLVSAGAAGSPAQEATPRLRIETRGQEIAIEYGPFELPAGASQSHVEPPAVTFALPVDGWMRGYVSELVDRVGRRVPSVALHHMNLIAKNRRDLFSNVMLRVGSAGPETEPVMLPRLLGVRLNRSDTLVMTLMLHNPTATSYSGVRLRVRVPFTPANARIRAIGIFPFSVAIGPKERPNVFDLPPGRSEHYWEGSPATAVRVLGVSGHLHRYGVALRLEDRTSGETMWEVRPRSDGAGDIVSMPVKLFLWSAGKPMHPDHVYRLTAVYDNPEPRTIRDGGMGVLGGIVTLSRKSRWPSVDPRHPEYLVDVRNILGEGDRGPPMKRDAAHGHR